MATSKGSWNLFHFWVSWLSLTWLAFVVGFVSLMISGPETSGWGEEWLKEYHCARFALVIAVVVGSFLHALLMWVSSRSEIVRRLHRHFCGSVGAGMLILAAAAVPLIYLGTPEHLRSTGDVPEGMLGGAGCGAILGSLIGTLWCLVEISLWTTRNLTPARRERVRWAIALTPVACLIAWAAADACYPGRPFDAAKWADKESRYDGVRQQMAARLVGWRLLDGKTRAEVRSMLGKPDERSEITASTSRRWMYFMGHERPFLFPLVESSSCAWLMLEFGEDGRVSRSRVFASSNCGCHDGPDPDELPGKPPAHGPVGAKR